ncbi:hypothetical protein EMPG_13035 [Blastomyces silverae]|uniref:Fe2OG dioxygenase domain-containing protein n=1 Tax=Blastomyces silverae TaxID=2060906 RepID=A0A0H1BLD7_9EURO|nr:hypothetical protein EMPG_13035 [Blastomyces silverae]
MSESIPTISLKQDREVVVSAIRSACLNHGFFQITDSDVPPSLSDRLMNPMQTIFGLLAPVKLSLKSNGQMLISSTMELESLCRLIHYKTPERDGGDEKNGKDEHDDIGASRHSDWGLLTVLLQDNVGRLQVLDLKTQTYIPVPPTPGAFVINCGDLLSRFTNGVYTSAKHMVVAPPPGVDRYSIALFNNGNPGHTVDVLPLGPEWKEWVQGQQGAAPQAKRLYEPITAGAYFEMNWKDSVAGQKQSPAREA